MKIIKGNTYWLESTQHGTLKGDALLVSFNQRSLLFKLSQTICLVCSGGMAITDTLPLLREGDSSILACIVDDSTWSVFENEPQVKIPTK
jgi:hypothetical protein